MSRTLSGAVAASDVQTQLLAPGFAVLPGAALRAGVGDEAELARFSAHWDDLVLDPYVGPEAADRFRYRRYARLRLTRRPDGGVHLAPLPSQSFVQAADHIGRYRGMARELAPATSAFLADPVLARLVALDESFLPVRCAAAEVGLHLIRIRAAEGLHSRPTPEGRHRDGHDYIAMHLVHRKGCQGGLSSVYPAQGDEPLATTTLSDPLDTIVVDDGAVTHEVTPIEPLRPGVPGIRDVLLVAFYDLEAPLGEGT